MNAERLLQHYEQIADAPDAIARLRRFILDLAVRGKLVPQDPADEPASELLKRIESGRRQAGAKQGTEAGGEVRPFDLPKGWVWSTIGSVCSKTGSGSTPRGGKEVYVDSGVPFLRSQNVYDDGLRLSDVAYIAPEVHARMAGTAVKPSDLLLNITGGSMGRCSLVPDSFGEANISQHVAIIRPVLTDMSGFMHRLVLSPYFQAFIFDEQTGAGRGGLPKNRMDQIAVALPPLAEQHRIVAKVDELMALCDELAAARTERETKRDRLAAAGLARLNTPDPETFRDDARFALDALPALTARPDQIKQLRQTILNLAVRGKLVPQDPADEPAEELLKRVQLSKQRSRKPTIKIDPRNTEYELPATWVWASLEQLVVFGPQNGISPRPTNREDAPKAITLTATTSGKFSSAYFKRVEGKFPPESDFWLSEGDLLFQRGNTPEYVGMAAVYEGPPQTFLFPDLIIKVRVSGDVDLSYVHLASISPSGRRYLIENASGAQATMPKINQTTLLSLPIPLPPLAEQHRIVAKVDELMALCDQLETSLTSADETRKKLLDALLAEALKPVDADALQEAAE
ncbi:MAG: restriction endonuclease subunit S [Allorhizobium sp.]